MLSAVFLAIQLIHPHLTDGVIELYATTMEEQAKKISLDPLVYVAIAEHESKFNTFAISGDGFDFGLMQVRAQFHNGGLHHDWLFNPAYNIRVASRVIKESVNLCRNHLGRDPLDSEWIACYMGSCGTKQSMCRPTVASLKRESFKDCLSQAVVNQVPISACEKIYN